MAQNLCVAVHLQVRQHVGWKMKTLSLCPIQLAARLLIKLWIAASFLCISGFWQW